MGRTDPAEWRVAAPIAYTSHIADNAGATDEQVGSRRARTAVRSTAPKGARLAATLGSGAVLSGEYPHDGFPAAPPRPAGAAQEAPAVTAAEAVATARPRSCNSAAARAPSLDTRPSTHASSSRRAPASGADLDLEQTPQTPVFIDQNWSPCGSKRVGKRLAGPETAGRVARRSWPPTMAGMFAGAVVWRPGGSPSGRFRSRNPATEGQR